MLYTSDVLVASPVTFIPERQNGLDSAISPSNSSFTGGFFVGNGRTSPDLSFTDPSLTGPSQALPGLDDASIFGRPTGGLSLAPSYLQIVEALTPVEEMIEPLLTAA